MKHVILLGNRKSCDKLHFFLQFRDDLHFANKTHLEIEAETNLAKPKKDDLHFVFCNHKEISFLNSITSLYSKHTRIFIDKRLIKNEKDFLNIVRLIDTGYLIIPNIERFYDLALYEDFAAACNQTINYLSIVSGRTIGMDQWIYTVFPLLIRMNCKIHQMKRSNNTISICTNQGLFIVKVLITNGANNNLFVNGRKIKELNHYTAINNYLDVLPPMESIKKLITLTFQATKL